MTNELDSERLRKRLDAIMILLIEGSSGGAISVAHKIERLMGLGFSAPEVAEIIGKKLNYVTAVTSGKKKAKAKKGSRT